MIANYICGPDIVVFYPKVKAMCMVCIEAYTSVEKIGQFERHRRYVEFTTSNGHDWRRLEMPTSKHILYSSSPQLTILGMLP